MNLGGPEELESSALAPESEELRGEVSLLEKRRGEEGRGEEREEGETAARLVRESADPREPSQSTEAACDGTQSLYSQFRGNSKNIQVGVL